MSQPPQRAPDDGDAITESEFSTWYTPPAVVRLLPTTWGWDTRLRFIHGRLEGGVFRAVALRFKLGESTRNLFELPPITWRDWAYLAGDDFWLTGDLDRFVGEYTRKRRLVAQQVRFEPMAVDREVALATGTPIAPAAALPIAAAPRLSAPLPVAQQNAAVGVSQAVVDDWLSNLPPEEADLPQRQLWQAAKAALGAVRRKQIEHYTAGRPRGPRRSA